MCDVHATDINCFCQSIINACLESSKLTIPCKAKSQKRTVPGWNECIEEHRQRALFWHSLWRENNCPHEGSLADIRRSTRANYHRAIRTAKKNKEKLSATKLAEALINDKSRNFWKEIRKIRCHKNNPPNNVDGVTGESEISNLFASKYKDLYNSVSYDSFDMCNLLDDVKHSIKNNCCNDKCYHSHCINVSQIMEGISFLKHGKKDGSDGHMTDHLKYGTNQLYTLLSLLFTSMMQHGYAPDNFLISTIVSIPKSTRKSMNSSDNYRGISLSSVLGKLYDWILLKTNSHVFKSSDLQFGFKPKHSTTQCTFIVNEVINYYQNGNSSVYVMLLDASKAFDCVHYIKLFRLLLRKGLCPLIARLLAFMYTNQSVKVRWGNNNSSMFHISNGVKQGGVLSPILFSVYIDELLMRLKHLGIGCNIGHLFMGAIAYADDVALLSPTKFALVKMLKAANSFSAEYNITFNSNKCKLVYYNGSQNDNVIIDNVVFNDITIFNSKQEKHLGHVIGPRSLEAQVQECIKDFYCKVNAVISQFSNVSYKVKYKLFKSFCMPLYGCQLWDLSSKTIDKFYIAWRKSIRRLLRIPNVTHNVLLNIICEDIPIEFQLFKRFLKFYKCIFDNDNVNSRTCGLLVLNGSRSAVSNTLTYICHKLNINKFDLFHFDVSKGLYKKIINNQVDVLERKCVLIKDLLFIRDNLSNFNFELYEVDYMIKHLCTIDAYDL